MYKKHLNQIWMYTLLLLIVTFPALVSAQEFKALVGIPGVTDLGKTASLPEYINAIYLVLIAVGGLIGVVRIVFAGVKYSLSDIVTNKSEAKEDIKGVLLGLVLLLLPWVVLNEIYPDLTKLDVLKNMSPVNIPNQQQAQNNNLPYATEPGTIQTVCKADKIQKRVEYKYAQYNTDECKKKCDAVKGTLSNVIKTEREGPTSGTTICTYVSSALPKDTSVINDVPLESLTTEETKQQLACFREGLEYSSISKSCDPGVTGPKSETEKQSLCMMGGGIWEGGSCVDNLANNAVQSLPTSSKEEIDRLRTAWKCPTGTPRIYESGGYTTFMCVK